MPEDIDIREQIKKLIQLQEMDAEIFDLVSQKEGFPARIKDMDGSLEEKKSGMKNAEDELKRVQLSKNEKDTDLGVKEEKISKHQSDLYQIKNNKEYQALQQEIDSIKADVSLLEEEIINLLDAIEAAQIRCEQEKKIFEEEKERVEKEKESIKAEEKKVSERLNELNAKRTEFAGTIDAGVRGQYERILKKWGRIAITEVNGEFCGVCNMQLRPQILNEAKLKNSLVFCAYCARMLYAQD
ncbi:zinc ribbon domain-containing protein [Candidatus Omnitrophota bacterium]